MAHIQFRAKIITVYNIDDTVAYKYIPVPTLGRHHCDMNAFRQHRKYGGFANSDLFTGMLKRIRSEVTGDKIRLDAIPENVTVDVSNFLATVTFNV